MSDDDDPSAVFEPASWEERYAGDGRVWAGSANPQLEAAAADLTPGTALDMGCGEGGDVLWLAARGWQVTGADFSANGLARAARAAEAAGVAERVEWMRVDARDFDPGERRWDLVTSHYLHPAAGRMAEVLPRLAAAVVPGGHLLVVGHAPTGEHRHADGPQRRAMFFAADIARLLPPGFEVLAAEERARILDHGAGPQHADDAVLFARRTG
ncbi:class I SAM-dependent methyltransferase [Agromyces archimandritae]|uniref:Class I SAM-dependent methyltransferase n=1 Tax=Agromyces archimandritae TaxID=2781962 RepID=A0A975FK03_9MICO|nr:class I SAM-dependent methyltransferase [Agromyces archimandritae]QTX03948.1 class I SAM-dependent methyltransferase [Agromyces archimandritae]